MLVLIALAHWKTDLPYILSDGMDQARIAKAAQIVLELIPRLAKQLYTIIKAVILIVFVSLI